jgi:hypothetical protein
MHDFCLRLEKCRQKTKLKFDFSEAKTAKQLQLFAEKTSEKNWEKDTLRKQKHKILVSSITYKISTFVLQKLICSYSHYVCGRLHFTTPGF